MLHQGYYLAETKIKIYKEPPQPIQGPNPTVTRIKPTTKVEHHFKVEENYI